MHLSAYFWQARFSVTPITGVGGGPGAHALGGAEDQASARPVGERRGRATDRGEEGTGDRSGRGGDGDRSGEEGTAYWISSGSEGRAQVGGSEGGAQVIADVSQDQQTQRRGRIVIVAMIVGFLLVCAVLGVFLWQRQQEEDRFDALRQTGLIAVAAPVWPDPIASVEPLERNIGLVVRYAQDGDVSEDYGPRALNLRAGTNPDPCALLAEAEPMFADPDRCEVSGTRVSAALNGPDDILIAEGQVRADTLVVLVAHPADFTAQELEVWLEATDLESLRSLFDRAA